jgi:hypothetical protein
LLALRESSGLAGNHGMARRIEDNLYEKKGTTLLAGAASACVPLSFGEDEPIG